MSTFDQHEATVTDLAAANTPITMRGQVYGEPRNARAVYLVVGGITANTTPFSVGAKQGWWDALLDASLIDLSKDAVLCPAMPGNGSSWPELDNATGSDLPRLSVMDLADLVSAWLGSMDLSSPVRYIGASFGGLVGLALAARHPKQVSRLVTVSAGLEPDGWGTGCRHLQRELVRQSIALGKEDLGMSWARQLGMLTYRGREELNSRFQPLRPEESRPEVASYLDHHGKRFAEQFPAKTFLLLSDAIDRCYLADTEQKVRQELARIQAEVAVIGVPGDLLFPWQLQVQLHRELRAANIDSSLWRMESTYGHDAFLVDQQKLATILKDTQLFRDEATTPESHGFRVTQAEPPKHIRLGLIGCGVVGQGLLELLETQRETLASTYGVEFSVRAIAVRDVTKQRNHIPASAELIDNPLDIGPREDVDVVVEAAGGIEGIQEAVEAALSAGKPVVTANKVLLSNKLPDLAALASRMAVPLQCEAAAAAALPILRTLNHRSDDVLSIAAIVNGTSNYAITRLEQDEMSLEEALQEAQAQGLAEADPSADIDGTDAACKLSILAYRCFGVWLPPTSLPTVGIRSITAADCDLADAMGYRVRHIARARTIDDNVEASVEPMLLPSWHLLANVEEEYNAVYMCFQRAGDLSLFGKGAGGLPTASALLSDLLDIAQGSTNKWPTPRAMTPPALKTPKETYLRVTGSEDGGFVRKIESHLRRLEIPSSTPTVMPGRDGTLHAGFLLRDATPKQVQSLQESVSRLGRVQGMLVMRVME